MVPNSGNVLHSVKFPKFFLPRHLKHFVSVLSWRKMKINPAPRYTQLSDKRIIKLLQRISQTIGLSVPDLYNYNGLAVWYIIYSILICLLLLGLCVYTLYCKCLYFYFDIIATVAILDSIAITSITLTNVISVLFTVIVRRRKIVQVVKHLKEIERTLNEKFDIVCQLNDRGLFLQFISLEIMIAAYVIFDSISEIKGNDVFHYSWTVVMHLNIIMVSVSVMQVQIVSTCIKQYFRVVNERLGATMQYPVWRKGEKSSNPKFGTVNMKFFLKLYDKLCDVIELTSKSHGIQIACISFIIIICLIESMNILMKFALRIAVMGGKSNINLLLADTWNSIIYIVGSTVVSENVPKKSISDFWYHPGDLLWASLQWSQQYVDHLLQDSSRLSFCSKVALWGSYQKWIDAFGGTLESKKSEIFSRWALHNRSYDAVHDIRIDCGLSCHCFAI